MSTRTSTRASTISTSQATQPKSQRGPKPLNKRSATGNLIPTPPAKVRKLTQSGGATEKGPVGAPGKSLASALKRRQQCVAPAKTTPVVVVPLAKRSPGKVRFSAELPLQDGRYRSPGDRAQGSAQTSETETVAQADSATTHTEPHRKPPPRTQDADFGTRYADIKLLAWNWVRTHFPAVDDAGARGDSLDLLRLAHTAPKLMEYANWTSCRGRERTWEDVFAARRAQLVYGVLGRVLELHVFGHEMFGADKEQLRELRELDTELLNKDGFYRQLCRAHKILAFLPDPNTPPPYFHHSLTDLCASVMELLSPLLPHSQPPELQPQLLTILLKAATLSLSMRRERKVVYHWETHPAVGSPFEEDSMHILNAKEHREEDDFRRNSDVEVVTMAGWPSCVAYRPHADVGKTKDGQWKKQETGRKAKLEIKRIGRAEVCVTFGPAIKPLGDEPENWLGKSLRVEMTERQEVMSAKDKNTAIARRAAGLGVTVLGLGYLVGNPWILEGAKGYLGSLV